MSLPDPDLHPECYEHVIARRFGAWVVDLAVTLVLMVLATVATGFVALFIFPVAWFAIAVAYRTLSLQRWGATPGMMLMALEWRRLDGSAPAGDLALPYAVLYALSMTFVVGQVISVVLMFNTPYRQGLNDWLMGTTIIRRYLLS